MREILEIAAQESGTTPEYIEQLEETDTNSLLYSLVAMGKTSLGQLPEICLLYTSDAADE